MSLFDIPELLWHSVIDAQEEWPWLDSKLNALAINQMVNVCRHRPHPWSTVHDYVSWTSLTDQRWSARHLPATYLQDLPESQKLVDMFRRPDGKQRFCNKSTLLFPAFAQYLTDGFIRTRMPKGDETDEVRRQNTSNHQIDLCPLYGRLPIQTDALRIKSEAPGVRGRLKSQIIAGEEYAPFLLDNNGEVKPEFAVLDEPLGLNNFTDTDLRAHVFAFGGDRANAAPQVAMLNTLFLREHNRLAGLIEAANSDWDDERVFQTARNTVIVAFIKIVVEEYINHISPAPFRLKADPSVAWDAPWNKPNWITTEFSLLYRWHSLIPDSIRWSDTEHPVGTTFMDNRLLINAGLAQSLVVLSSQRAAQLGAFNTANALLGVEKAAIDQGRTCNVAPYADYRAYVALPRPNAFSDICENGQVIDFLKGIYNSVADVDFYIGLFAEDVGPNSPLPPLILRLVAVDAFSQALTNPLLSKSVFNPNTFSQIGWETINNTSTLRDVLMRNSPTGEDYGFIGMTQADWKFTWT